MIAPNTIVKMELNNGEIARLTLNWKGIYNLKGKNKTAYNEYIRVSNNGVKGELDIATILYAAYIAASEEETLGFTDFLELMPTNREYCADLINELQPKKKSVSEGRLKSAQKK